MDREQSNGCFSVSSLSTSTLSAFFEGAIAAWKEGMKEGNKQGRKTGRKKGGKGDGVDDSGDDGVDDGGDGIVVRMVTTSTLVRMTTMVTATAVGVVAMTAVGTVGTMTVKKPEHARSIQWSRSAPTCVSRCWR
jgi:hypothetical protein